MVRSPCNQPFPAFQPAETVDGIPIKRPPEDEEPWDLSRAPSKRRAFEAATSKSRSLEAMSSSETDTNQQLWDKSPEELISIIHTIQASHHQQVADLQAQYAVVCGQLEKMKSIVNTCLATQTRTIQSVQRDIAAITAPPPVVKPYSLGASTQGLATEKASVDQDRPSVSTSTLNVVPTSENDRNFFQTVNRSLATPQRELLGSPPNQTPASASADDLTPSKPRGKVDLKITPAASPSEPPNIEQSSLDTVQEVWEEWQYGRNGNPSLQSIDALWGTRWRPDSKLRVWYGRRKVILDQIRTYMADGIPEEAAVAEVEKMRCGRTLNWLSRILQDNRKQTRKQWKEAQKAATAAKQATHGASWA